MTSEPINGASAEVIRAWFRHLAMLVIKAIKPETRWNMDEAGLLEGQRSNGLVLGSRERRSIQRKHPGSRIWTTFIECISATGSSLSPLVIFKGKTVQQQWFPTDLASFEDWKSTATPNGWTDDNTALEWLEKIFIPRSAPSDLSERRLLIMDGHGSHVTTEFTCNCF